MWKVVYSDELYHHGIKGQKWGVRRFQNSDGTLTAEGKRHYGKTVFVSGSSKTQSIDSGYYRKSLPKSIRDELELTIQAQGKVLVGDAPGVDRQVQDYLNKRKYSNVTVYSPGKEARYLANKRWENKKIDASEFEEGSKEWLAKKDIAMANDSQRGLAVILDEGAKATRKNVQRLIDENKDVSVYELNKLGRKYDTWTDPHGV